MREWGFFITVSALADITINETPKKMPLNNYYNLWAFKRAVNGARTHDPQLGKLMLYQLSYYRLSFPLSLGSAGWRTTNPEK
jgi:hypothetical protein